MPQSMSKESPASMTTDNFKTCTSCKAVWPSRSHFLADPEIVLVGYQVDFAGPEPGYFLFNHTSAGCGTTMGIEALLFKDMSGHAVDEHRGRKRDPDSQDCLYLAAGEPCQHRCECSFVKDVCAALLQCRPLVGELRENERDSEPDQEKTR